MFGSQVLEVGIGLVMFYLLLSLGFTTLNEAISSLMGRRSKDLRKGIEQLLQDNSRVDDLYNHPLIKSLSKNGNPSYIPSKTFSHSLVSTIAGAAKGFDEVHSRLSENENSMVNKQLLLLMESAHGDMEKALKNIEDWFDNSMERVAGWYKRWTMAVTFGIALVVCAFLNADTIMMAKLLWSDAGFRAAVGYSAAAAVNNPEQLSQSNVSLTDTSGGMYAVVQQIHDANFPLGWSNRSASKNVSYAPGDPRVLPSNLTFKWTFIWWLYKGIGILFTVFAIMLGAPFWFDFLNSIMKLRSTGTQARVKA